MAAKTYVLDDLILQAVLNSTAYVQPANTWVGLFTTVPANPGDAGTEVTTVATGYVRQATGGGLGWTASVGTGVASNTGIIQFPVATAAYGFEVTGVGIFSAVAAGDLLYYGTLGTPKTVGLGDSVSFAIGALVVTES